MATDYQVLGVHADTRDALLVPEVDRFSGCYIVGKPGSGKSGLLENLIFDDASKGRAVFVIDPHGDLITNCLAGLNAMGLSNAYVLDIEDEDYPFGINLFAIGNLTSDAARSQAVDRILHVFEVLWPEVATQQMLPLYLRSATIALLNTPGATLVDMLRFLENDDFRAAVLRNRNIEQSVRDFWRNEFDTLSAAERRRRVQSLVNRLHALFMGRPMARNIVGQQHASISFRRAIENRELVFIRLPVNTLKLESELIGTLVLAQISAAVFSFADLPESQRPGVSIYVDEFQNFCSPDVDVLITQARKYKARLILAHQYRSQVPDYLQKSTVQSRTIVSFQVEPGDASELAPLFPVGEAKVRPEDIELHPIKHLLEQTPDDKHVKAFVDMYLRPMLSYKHGNMIDIEGEYLTIDKLQLLLHGYKRGIYKEAKSAPDPAIELDPLLREVMRTGNWHLTIPIDGVTGFSNANSGGHNFFKVIYSKKHDVVLFGGYIFPAELVQGERWIGGYPKNALDQFRHCAFALRMTMKYLAEHPVGKTTKPTAAATAQRLIHLPRRTALVKAGNDTGMIVTQDTPSKVSGHELQERLQYITEHTRSKYCHPRAEVEYNLKHGPEEPPAAPVYAEPGTRPGAPAPAAAKEMQPIAGWGVVNDEP